MQSYKNSRQTEEKGQSNLITLEGSILLITMLGPMSIRKHAAKVPALSNRMCLMLMCTGTLET
jgi:hypothetical protein